MADQIIIGRIYTAKRLSADEALAFSANLTQCAEEYGLRVNTDGGFKSELAKYNYPAADYTGQGYIPYEITDCKGAYEADGILSGIHYGVRRQITDLSCSGLPALQAFLERVLDADAVQSAALAFELAHGSDDSEYTERVIHANELCKALTELPSTQTVPMVRLRIVKGSGEALPADYLDLGRYAHSLRTGIERKVVTLCLLTKKHEMYHIFLSASDSKEQILRELKKLLPEGDRQVLAIFCYRFYWELGMSSLNF